MSTSALTSRLGRPAEVTVTVGAIVAVYLLLVYGTYWAYTSRVPGGNDFYPRWRGTRALVLEGKDPYSEEVTLEIQRGVYGRPARADEDQVAFAYPLYACLFFLPFSLLSYPVAQAFWLSALILALLAALLVILQTIDWAPSPAALVGLALWSVVFYPTTRSILLGQISILILGLVAVALLAMRRGNGFLAGCLLALSTIKPQMIFLLAPFLLVTAVKQRAYRTVVGFLSVMSILLAVSWAVLPGWIPSFLAGLDSYHSYTGVYRGGTSPIGWVVTSLLPPTLSGLTTLAVSVGLGLCLAYSWYAALNHRLDASTAVSFTIVATLLLPGETGTTNQVLLLLPLIHWLSIRRKQRWLSSLVSVALIVGPWLLFLSTVQGDLEHPMMVIPLPLAVLGLLLWRSESGTTGELAQMV